VNSEPTPGSSGKRTAAMMAASRPAPSSDDNDSGTLAKVRVLLRTMEEHDIDNAGLVILPSPNKQS